MKSTWVIVLFLAIGCGSDDNAKQDAGNMPHDAGVSEPDASCFNNPTTHYEIINACTTAQKIYKDSHPPLLKPDGTLPALPP
jgi:hypothetical protein